MGFLDNLWNGIVGGGSDAAAEQMRYQQQVPGILKQYYDPYVQQGQEANNVYRGQLDKMLANNGIDFVNDIYNSYEESPQYKFASDQATMAANNAAAAGGTLGTGAHQAQLADYIQGLSSRDQDNYYSRIMGNYNNALSGYGGIADRGYQASSALAGGLTQNAQDMGALAAQKRAAEINGAMSTLGIGLGALGGFAGLPIGSFAPKAGTNGGQATNPTNPGGWKGALGGILPFF